MTVAWTASTDDNAGASDVVAYAVRRRPQAGTTWTTVGSYPARGTGTYSFTDYALLQGTWIYGVFAMDCGPTWSAAAEASASVTVP